MKRFHSPTAMIMMIVAIGALVLNPVFGMGAFAGQSEEAGQNEEVREVVVLPDQVAVVSTETSLIAYDEGETVQVLNELNRYTWFQHEDKARDDFCWFATDHAEEKGWTLEEVSPLPEWEPCGNSGEASSAGTVQQSNGSSGGCTAWTETHDPATGDWGLSNNGPMIVHFWSNRTSDQAEYKLFLRGGSYALPGGGKVYKYPGGCDEQASVEYTATELPAITLDKVMSLVGIISGGGNSSGSDSDGGCTAWTKQHDPVNGDWNLSHEGPMIIHFWSNQTSDQSVYKLFLRGGSYTLPGGGTAFLYPASCGGQASVEYDATEFSAITLDQVMSLTEGSSGNGNSGGGESTNNCSATSNEAFAPNPGQPWNFGHDGPMVVNFWSNWPGSQEGTYKFLLEQGSYSLPGGGDVTYFPSGCNDAAGAAFEANGNPAGDWGYIDALKAGGTDTGSGSDPGTTPSCEPTETTSFDPTPGTWWNFSSNGPVVVNFWSNWTEDNTTYKFLLGAGSYSLPGGGDATMYPDGCNDAAGAAFESNGNTAGDWDYVMSMGSSYNGEEPSPSDPGNGGENPGSDCSATSSESFSSTPGTWWNFGHDGPMVVNFYSNWGSDQTTYKFLLGAGSYSMPGGGDVTKFSVGCDTEAGAQFDANPNPAGDWDYVMSFAETAPSNDPAEQEVETVEETAVATQTEEAVEETTPVPIEEAVDPTETPEVEETEVDPSAYGGLEQTETPVSTQTQVAVETQQRQVEETEEPVDPAQTPQPTEVSTETPVAMTEEGESNEITQPKATPEA